MRISFPTGALWQHAGFLRLWAAQTVSSFGARIAREGFAMTAILTIHAAPAELGILAALARGPGIVVGLVAGGFVDRSSRRRIMIASDLARTLLIATIPLAAWMHRLAMPQIYLVAALVGAAQVLFEIADHAFLPTLIAREHLIDGNAKLGVTDSASEIVGPAVAGTLFQLLTAPIAMLGTSITYLASALLLIGVPSDPPAAHPSQEVPHWRRDLAAGIAAILSHRLLKPLFWMTLAGTFFGSFFWPLYLAFGLRDLGLSPALMGVTIAMGGAGALFAALLSTTLSRRFGVGPTIVVCSFANAGFLALVPLAGGPHGLAVGMLMLAQFAGDAVAVAAIIPMISLRQAVLPGSILGRAVAVFSAASGAATVAGALIGGALGTAIGPRATLLISVAGLAAAPFFAVFSPLLGLAEIPGVTSESAPHPPAGAADG